MSVSGESSSDGRRRLSAGLNVPRDTRMLPLMDTVNDFKAEEKKKKQEENKQKKNIYGIVAKLFSSR